MRKLATRIKDEDSKYWRAKADTLWSRMVRGLAGNKCAICGSERMVQAHHLIPREVKHTRHALLNGLSLCCDHHKFSRVMSAHKSPVLLFHWIITKDPTRWAWLVGMLNGKHEAVSYKKSYELLLEQQNDIKWRTLDD